MKRRLDHSALGAAPPQATTRRPRPSPCPNGSNLGTGPISELASVCDEIILRCSTLPIVVNEIRADGSYFSGHQDSVLMHVIAEAELPGSADRVLVDLLSMTQAEPGYNNPMDRDLVAGHSTCTFCEQILSTQLASKVSDSSGGLGDAFPAYLCRWISTSFSSTAPDVLDVYIAKVCEWANLITWAQIDCCQDVDDLKHLLFANLQNMISKSCTTNSFRVHLTQQPHRLVPSKHSDGVQVLAWLPSSRDVAQNVALSTPTLPLHDPSLSSFCDISDRQGPGPASYRHWARLQLHWLGAARRVLGHALSYTLEMHQHGGGGAPAAEDPDEEAPTLASHLEEWLSDLLACPAAAAELQATLLPEAFLQDLGEALLESEGPRPSEEVVHRARELWAASGWWW
ncbi:unnamed protein product [Heterosigma akashiwo]